MAQGIPEWEQPLYDPLFLTILPIAAVTFIQRGHAAASICARLSFRSGALGTECETNPGVPCQTPAKPGTGCNHSAPGWPTWPTRGNRPLESPTLQGLNQKHTPGDPYPNVRPCGVPLYRGSHRPVGHNQKLRRSAMFIEIEKPRDPSPSGAAFLWQPSDAFLLFRPKTCIGTNGARTI